jgi:hypothetical protein
MVMVGVAGCGARRMPGVTLAASGVLVAAAAVPVPASAAVPVPASDVLVDRLRAPARARLVHVSSVAR